MMGLMWRITPDWSHNYKEEILWWRRKTEQAHLGSGVDLVQIKYELGQILNRVNVVVRRRRDESDARLRQTESGDVLIDLGAGELSALAGLCTLKKER